VILAPRVVAVALVIVLVPTLLAFREVAGLRVVDRLVPGLLALREVSDLLLLDRLRLHLLALGEGAVRVVVIVIVIVIVVMLVVGHLGLPIVREGSLSAEGQAAPAEAVSGSRSVA
jgi:uncharacterized membrane protein YjjB (DUF3815 family)